jgi:hypothetical protein
LLHPGGREAVLLGADSDCDGAGEGRFGELEGSVGSSGDDGDGVGFKEREGVLTGGFEDREGEESAYAGADDVGVMDIGSGIADDDSIDAGGVAGAEDGAEIAGLFNAFCDDEKRIFLEGEIFEGQVELWGNGEEAVRTVPIGNFGKDLWRALNQLGAGLVEEGSLVGAEKKLRAIKKRMRFSLSVESSFELAITFDEEEICFFPFPSFAKLDDLFNFGVL